MRLKDFDFRIWDGKKYLNNIKGGVYIHKNDYIKCLIRDQYCYDYEFELNDIDKSNLEIEFFAGLYDKNGKKIYENDIVRYNNDEKLVVKFIDGTFVVCPNYDEFIKIFKYEKGEEDVAKESYFETSYKLYIQAKNNICNKLDIIGNIHENAELLK